VSLDPRAATAFGRAAQCYERGRPSYPPAAVARVLKTRGGLGLLWNVPTWNDQDTPWLPAFRATVRQHKRAAGDYPAGKGEWEQPLADTRLFAALQHADDAHLQHLDIDDFVAQVASWSWIAALCETRRAAVLLDVRARLGARTEIVIPYRTDIYWTRRR